MAETDAVLLANESFYGAFAAADLAAMARLWASELPVAVIHPGAPPITGRAAVLQSWQAIFGQAKTIDIVCTAPTVQRHGALAIVLCFERINGHRLAASNVFRRSAGAWLMVMHQASPLPAAPSRGVVH